MLDMEGRIAVAMSVYAKDSASWFLEAVESVLLQSYGNFVLFIQVDGKVENNLYEAIKYVERNDRVVVIFNHHNLGLARRLNDTIELVVEDLSFSYLARMDADDVCSPFRFEKQVSFMRMNPEIGIVGSDVIEIDEDGRELFYKRMPSTHDEIFKNIIKRCPFNHPSVLIDLAIFRQLGLRYKNNLMNTQDYYLWIDMLASNVKFGNLNDVLLKFRLGADFHSRRGVKKAFNDLRSRLYAFRHLDVLTVSNVFHVVFLFLLRLAPVSVKKFAYKYLR